jgi:trimethylamine---corrinoid protein Co-methyltransferase
MEISDDTRAMETMDRVDPGGHHLGTDHTMYYKDASYEASFFNCEAFEIWRQNGAKDTLRACSYLLSNYEFPAFGKSIEEGLIDDYMKRRKEEEASKRPQKTKVTAS